MVKKKRKYPPRGEKWKIGDSRKINGLYFHRYLVDTKRVVQQRARNLRDKGWLVRLIKMKRGGYSLFRRKRKR